MILHLPIQNLVVQVALPSAARPAVVVVGVLYFAVIVAISVRAARRTRTASDFFVAGKGIGLIALTVASVSVSVSGFAFIGGPGFIYAVGLGAMYIVLPAAVTNVMGAWVLAKRMRLLGEARSLITVPDAIGARYRSPAAQGLAAIAMLVGIVGYMATNALAMGVVINSIFGVGLGWGIWIGMGVTLAYSASGGILAGIYNDVFQGTLMAIASVLVFLFVLGFAAGWERSHERYSHTTSASSGRGGSSHHWRRCPSFSFSRWDHLDSHRRCTSTTCCAIRSS